MATVFGLPLWLVTLSLLAAVAGLLYFLVSGLRADHETGEYRFTWGIGVVVLFLLGFAPGLVGLGLYLTVERNYPVYWLVAFVAGSLVVVTLVSYGVQTTTVAESASNVVGVYGKSRRKPRSSGRG
jgi:hypothetical protein